MVLRSVVSALALSLLFTGAAQAQKWGDLSGQFLYEGAVEAAVITPTKDVEACSKHKIFDEGLVVDPATKGVSNVVVWLFPASGTKVTAHDSYKDSAAAKVKVDNAGCRFEPHVSFVRVGQTLDVLNSDPVGHNTMINTFNTPPVNPILPAGGSIEAKFTAEETLPAKVSCSIHPWMTAWVVVKDHPYVAISDKTGNFTIKNLPVGDWNFKVWQESGGYAREINGTALKKGVWAVSVKEGANDAGKLKVKLKE